MIVRNEVRRGFYLDSVALMRTSRTIAALPGVEEAGLMIATPANKEILRAAGVLGEDGEHAGPGDLVIALRARDALAADTAMAEARRLLDQPRRVVGAGRFFQRQGSQGSPHLEPQ